MVALKNKTLVSVASENFRGPPCRREPISDVENCADRL